MSDIATEGAGRAARAGRGPTSARWLLPVGVAALAIVPALVWPAVGIHDDAFDELTAVEGQELPLIEKHPLSEPSLWLLCRLGALLGLGWRAFRIAQVENALCVGIGLAVLAVVVRRGTGSTLLAAVSTGCVGATFAALHFRHDPFLFYWPPALAMTTGAAWLLTSGEERWRLGLATLLAALAVLFNPMMLPFCVALFIGHALDAPPPRVRPRHLAVLVPVVAYAAVRLALGGDESGGVYGRWLADTGARTARAMTSALAGSEELEASTAATVVAWTGVLAMCAWVVVRGRAHLPRIVLGALVAQVAFASWWDPGQPFFYVTLPWFAVLAFGLASNPSDRSKVAWTALFGLTVVTTATATSQS